jgi:hypothetical protein
MSGVAVPEVVGKKRPLNPIPVKPIKTRKIAVQIIAASDLGKYQSLDGSEFSIDLSKCMLFIPSHATNVTASITKAVIPFTWNPAV